MAFDFNAVKKDNNIHQTIVSGLDTFRRAKMDEFMKELPYIASKYGCRDYEVISGYVVENGRIYIKLAPLTSRNLVTVGKNGEYHKVVVLQGLLFNDLELPIDGFKVDRTELSDRFEEIIIDIYFYNLNPGVSFRWNKFKDDSSMLTDDWADNFSDDFDLSEFGSVFFKSSFKSYYALKKIVNKFKQANTIEISKSSGILVKSPSKRYIYTDISKFQVMNTRFNHEVFSERVFISDKII